MVCLMNHLTICRESVQETERSKRLAENAEFMQCKLKPFRSQESGFFDQRKVEAVLLGMLKLGFVSALRRALEIPRDPSTRGLISGRSLRVQVAMSSRLFIADTKERVGVRIRDCRRLVEDAL